MRHSKPYSVCSSPVFALHILTDCPCTFAALIGYWLAPFCAVVFTEHFLFRRTFAAYNVLGAWDDPRHPNLPRPYPALCAFAVSIAFIVLCMEQQWYTGPIARQGTGDLGMILGFAVSVPVYAAARCVQLNWSSLRKRMGSLEGLRRRSHEGDARY